ncbi:hypothetical protein JZ751_022292 [Albula glossodonta]|uniref:Uncharacterized protein n=1 Tax=Albula glossodonta TaxID=121402 RepID=A0A8T2NUF0_9TELE|nr:hypothetical protein JZ751_022292 [Albula glossodonta]
MPKNSLLCVTRERLSGESAVCPSEEVQSQACRSACVRLEAAILSPPSSSPTVHYFRLPGQPATATLQLRSWDATDKTAHTLNRDMIRLSTMATQSGSKMDSRYV